MSVRDVRFAALIAVSWLMQPGAVVAQGYPGYPYTIMVPERGAAGRHHTQPSKRARDRLPARRLRMTRSKTQRSGTVARGSSGAVLPTPLPRTPLIPPEGGGVAAVRDAPREPPLTIVPGIASPFPNLPHGPETFQDRASRCAFQQGLYGVPGTMSTQYMAACVH